MSKKIISMILVLSILFLFEQPAAASVSAGVSKLNQNTIQEEEEYPAVRALESRLQGHNKAYDNVAITTVENYVNIRTEPTTNSDIVGKIYNNCGAHIDETISNEEGDWYLIHSGSCQGYVLSEFFYTGQEAKDIAASVSTTYATIDTDELRLRETPSLDGKTLTTLFKNEKYEVVSDEREFVKVKIDDDIVGYLLTDYVNLEVKFEEAISLEEEQAKLEEQARREREQRTYTSTSKSYSVQSSISSSRTSLVNYACSFVGSLPYVYGGNSLSSGTDCSGFVHMIFAAAGIGVGRTDVALRSAGAQISSENMRPGDIICYYGHVAIYIGNGQVVHCSTANAPLSQQTKISYWNYRSVCCIVNPWGD